MTDTVRIKTAELSGPALDWVIDSLEGTPQSDPRHDPEIFRELHDCGRKNFSTDWAQGGPIADKKNISMIRCGDESMDPEPWAATTLLAYVTHPNNGTMFGYHAQELTATGPTPLIAAMRCYVAFKLGDEIDIPTELVPNQPKKMKP